MLNSLITSRHTHARWLRLFAVLLWLVGALLVPALGHAQTGDQSQQLLAQDIRYHNTDAGEVVLVWGIDGWQVLPEAIRPAGTVVSKNLMLTPMLREGGTFHTRLQAPRGAKLDYGFLIKKDAQGVEIQPIWDGNGGSDYHTAVDQERTIEVEAHPSAVVHPTKPAEASTVAQQLRYEMPEAGEVQLVWGIDGWQTLPEAQLPAGTTIEKNLMYTLMQPDGPAFSANLNVPAGSRIDFGFLITKKRDGAVVRVWESNGDKDFAAQATQNGVVDIRSKLSLGNVEEKPRDFDLGLPLLLALLGLTVLAVVLVYVFLVRRGGARASRSQVIVCTGLTLWLLMLPMRANALNFGWISAQYSLPLIPATIWAGLYDLVFVGVITALFAALAWLLRARRGVGRALVALYMILALFSLLVALTNTKVVAMLGRPFNYQWFYYSDFLGSTEAKNAIMANVSSSLLLNGTAFTLMLLGFAFALSYASSWVAARLNPRRYARFALIGALVAYVPAANWQISAHNWQYGRLANPVAEFVNSVFGLEATPGFFTMKLPPGSLDEFTAKPATPAGPAIQPPAGPKIRNVVLFVMESVAAEYVGAYGSHYPVTPVLDRYRSQSLLYEHVYAHAPASNQSLVSLLGSVYPWISYRGLTEEYPHVSMPTLSSELKRQGYRTAFLSAADIRFQNGDQFLSSRQFDTVADYRSPQCSKHQFFVAPVNGWTNLDGANEECLVSSFGDWLGTDTTTPFFTMMWTDQTHHPYMVDGPEVDYGVDDKELNRYLNALHHSDMVLGQVLQTLQQRGLSDSTLVVVVGDHGEAFGRHNQRGHGGNIYQENLHVPLFFIQPRLFNGASDAKPGGMIDVAPTIMHLLGLPSPAAWQGTSLLNQQRSGRVYFCAPWSDFLIGYRDGDMKVMVNASKNTIEVYNLANDPQEQNNLASQSPELIAQAQQHLGAWVQYHDQYMKQLIGQ